ncbi:MAG: hypothetical protein HC830_08070 [Bacteroidetes bacterium]|nr:hypothetical protein [Bacteroidota bacterium]
MKKHSFIYLLLIAVIGMVSCEKMIELEPKSNYTFNNMWSNEAEATSGILAIYNQMQSTFKTNYAYWGDGRSDMLVRYNNDNEALYLIDNALVATMSSSDWNSLYKVISRSNFAIKYIPKVPD